MITKGGVLSILVLIFILIFGCANEKKPITSFSTNRKGVLLFRDHYLLYMTTPCCRPNVHSSGCFWWKGDSLFLLNMASSDSLTVNIRSSFDSTLPANSKRFSLSQFPMNWGINTFSIVVNGKYRNSYVSAKSKVLESSMILENLDSVKNIQLIDTVRGYSSPIYPFNDHLPTNTYLIIVSMPRWATNPYSHDWTDTVIFIRSQKTNDLVRVKRKSDSYNLKYFFNDTLLYDPGLKKYRTYDQDYAESDEMKLWRIRSCFRIP